MEFSQMRTVACVAVIIGCFAILYPRFIHPLGLRMFGLHKKNADQSVPSHPPGFGRPMPNIGGDKKGSAHHHHIDGRPPPMRGGPHPGLRAAADMQRQSPQGSGRGMMGIVLPMYAVGIVLYLIYTLVKVFNKRGNNHSGGPFGHTRMQQYRQQQEQFKKSSKDDPADIKSFINDEDQHRNLERLLTRAEDQDISVDEMRELQRRLEETEAQMHKILQAMQTVQQKVTTATDSDDKTADDSNPVVSESEKTVNQSEAADEKTCTKADASVDASPDTESYEMVKKISSSDASPVTEDEVETIASEEAGQNLCEQGAEDGEGKREADDDEDVENVEEVVLKEKALKDEESKEESGVRQRKPLADTSD